MTSRREAALRGLFSMLILTVLSLCGCSTSTTTEPIWIGHIAPFAGPDKIIGEHSQQGIDLAVEEVNKEDNRIAGRQVKVFQPRIRADAATVVSETVRLIKEDRVVAFLAGTSAGQAERMARAAQPYDVAVITSSGLPASSTMENLFTLAATPASRGEALARFAARGLKVSQGAVLTDNGTATSALATAFIREFSKTDGHRALELNYAGDADLAPILERLQSAKPQVLLVARPVEDLFKLREKLKSANLTVPILFGGEEVGASRLQQDRDASRGVYLAASFAVDGQTPSLQEFVKKYRERFAQDPDIDAALGYESSQLLIQALRQARNLQAGRVREELARIPEFDSLTGAIAISREHGVRRPVFIIQFKEGQTKTVERYEAEEK